MTERGNFMSSRLILVLVVSIAVAGCGAGGGAYTPPQIVANIAGRITDATNSAAIAGATVSASSGSSVLGRATTNATGDYTLANLSTPSTTITWAVSAVTYRSFSTSLNVSSGGSYTVNYAMARQVGSVSGMVAAAPTSLAVQAGPPPGPTGAVKHRPLTLPTYVADRVLVKFRQGSEAGSIQALHQQVNGSVLNNIPNLGVQVVQVAPGYSTEAAITAYRASPLVEYAEQDVYAYLHAIPNDQFYYAQWHYPQINLPAAWDVTTGSAGVIVAVVDTGIRPHPDLNGITVQGFNFVNNTTDPTDPGCSVNPAEFSHGMHVTGTIDAQTNNSIGVAGVNWGGVAGTKIMPIRVLGEVGGVCGVGTFSAIASGIIYATDHGAKVINMSLGSAAGSLTLESSVSYAFTRGVTLVASAGNDNGPVSYPAKYANVIAVAATACDDTRASYSNFGPEVAVAAPGGDPAVTCRGDPNTAWVWSTSWSPNVGNAYPGFVGTSMAAPHVSGVVALIISRGITGPTAIRQALQNTATHLGTPGCNAQFGCGLVNAAAAVGGGTSSARLRAFAGTISGSVITIRSDVVEVASNGSFVITNAHAGTRSVFVWQDFNGNGIVDTADYFGQVDGVIITDGGMTSGVAVTVHSYSGIPITLLNVLTVQRLR
jgi:serine protease